MPFHLVDYRMGDNPRSRKPLPNEKNPKLDNSQNATTHNIYSISSTVTPSVIDSPSRLAEIIRQEQNSRIFLRLKLKPLITPFHILSYYLMMLTMFILIQFIVVHMTFILLEQYHVP